ncbi:MAG: hypothetical protein IJ422_03975 [Oscillospiraceae bacterium]|nr:hypothetical protein [Oscillospiraceae bacterium]
MRKHNEGYALPLVLVVMVVLCLVAMTMMSVSLRNMENQRASIERMQDQYIAEGTIEAVLAELEHTNAFTLNEETVSEVLEKKLKGYCETLETENGNLEVLAEDHSFNEVAGALNRLVYTFSLTVAYGSAQVKCEIEMTGTYAVDGGNCMIPDPVLTYKSYAISTVAEGGEAA